jgi:hypothetical protein
MSAVIVLDAGSSLTSVVFMLIASHAQREAGTADVLHRGTLSREVFIHERANSIRPSRKRAWQRIKGGYRT